jgi:hypothetical protein
MGGRHATGRENFAFMSNCCETRKSREFCGCDAWIDGWAHGVVSDGRNFCVVSNCCDVVEFGRFVVSSRAGGRFILCRGSICCHSVRPCHPTPQPCQLVDGLLSDRAVRSLVVRCCIIRGPEAATPTAPPTLHRLP